jgi:DNA-binding transcriptional LysR family regulator
LIAPSGEKRQVRTAGWLTVNDGQSLLNAAISGLGIAYLPSFFVRGKQWKKAWSKKPFLTSRLKRKASTQCTRPAASHSPKCGAFIDFLVHSFAEKGPDAW